MLSSNSHGALQDAQLSSFRQYRVLGKSGLLLTWDKFPGEMDASSDFQVFRWSTQQPQPGLCVACETQSRRAGATVQGLPSYPPLFSVTFLCIQLSLATESRPEKGRQLRETFVGVGIVTPEETGHSLSESKQPVYTTVERASERISSTTLPGKVVPLWSCL